MSKSKAELCMFSMNKSDISNSAPVAHVRFRPRKCALTLLGVVLAPQIIIILRYNIYVSGKAPIVVFCCVPPCRLPNGQHASHVAVVNISWASCAENRSRTRVQNQHTEEHSYWTGPPREDRDHHGTG